MCESPEFGHLFGWIRTNSMWGSILVSPYLVELPYTLGVRDPREDTDCTRRTTLFELSSGQR